MAPWDCHKVQHIRLPQGPANKQKLSVMRLNSSSPHTPRVAWTCQTALLMEPQRRQNESRRWGPHPGQDLGIREDEYKVRLSQSRAAAPNAHRCTPAIPGDGPNQVPEQGNRRPFSPRSRTQSPGCPWSAQHGDTRDRSCRKPTKAEGNVTAWDG